MKVEARISETGQLVRAVNDADWALVHPPEGKGPKLYCPDPGSLCRNTIHAVEIRNRRKGTITRFFRFPPKSTDTCTHGEAEAGVVVPDPTTKPPEPTSGGETPEHQWLKQFVHDTAQQLGYSPELERTLDGGVRADVWVPGVDRGRVEVQRVATDLPSRTDAYPDVLWLLRETALTRNTTNYLFDLPCVQVRISKRVTVNGQSKPAWVPAKPWEGDSPLSIRASSTVLRPRKTTNAVGTRGSSDGGSGRPILRNRTSSVATVPAGGVVGRAQVVRPRRGAPSCGLGAERRLRALPALASRQCRTVLR